MAFAYIDSLREVDIEVVKTGDDLDGLEEDELALKWYEVMAFDPNIYFCFETFRDLIYEHVEGDSDAIADMRVIGDRMFVGLTYNYDWGGASYEMETLLTKNLPEICSCDIIEYPHYHLDPEPYLISYLIYLSSSLEEDYIAYINGGRLHKFDRVFNWGIIDHKKVEDSIEVILEQCNDIDHDELRVEHYMIDFGDEETMNSIYDRGEILFVK